MRVGEYHTKMNNFIRHEQCPKCAKEGKDRGHNNLGVYSDGGVYCYACGYFKSGSAIKTLAREKDRGSASTTTTVCLPRDVDFSLPQKAWDHLSKYSLTNLDALKHRIMWSEEWQRVIFPYFAHDQLIGWQGRYLGKENKAKWYSQGILRDLMHICGYAPPAGNPRPIVLTEDVISAIRVGHVTQASPLFGSHISTKAAMRYHKFFDNIVIWLDKDKQMDSIKFTARLNNLGITTRNIITDKDPKEYTDTEIVDILK